jgi:hypothetical protein
VTAGARRFLRDRGAATIALGLVLGFALKVTFGLRGTFDLYFDDETIYLDAAKHLHTHFLPLAESSPLYPQWYKVLGLFERDPIELYFLSWFLLTAGLPIALFALARRSGAGPVAAAAVAIVWALSSTSMTWPFVSKFATLLLALGAIAATYPRDVRVSLAVGSGAVSAAAFARAELALPAAGYALVVVVVSAGSLLTRRARGPWRGALAAIAISIGPPIALRAAFGKAGNPFAHGRQFFAFGQHYALNVVEDRRLSVDPWTSWLPLAREAFPTATTIGDAARENPGAFAWHIERNLVTATRAFEELLAPLAHQPPIVASVSRGLLWATLLGAFVGIAARWRARRRTPIGRWLPLYGAVVVATAAAALLVYPRQHYILPLTFLTLAALAGATSRAPMLGERRASRVTRRLRVAAFACGALLLAAFPTARRGWLPSLLDARGPAPPTLAQQENRATILALREMSLFAPPWGPVPPRPSWMPSVVIFEPDYSRGVYAFHDWVWVPQSRKTVGFWHFVRATWTNVIVINWRMRGDIHMKDDPEFVAFVDGTGEREDFEMFPVEGTTVVLAVRRSLLQFASPHSKR